MFLILYAYGVTIYRHGMELVRWSVAMARIQWQRFVWRGGADEYAFEVTDGGLYGKLSVSGGREVVLPMVAWEGMLDCVAMARKGKAQNERMQPDRAFARWSDEEVARLEAGFQRGRSIVDLARQHNRSQDAVEHQLVKLGLWNRLERRPMSQMPPYPENLEWGEPPAGRAAESIWPADGDQGTGRHMPD
jgi:hypothetical protein